MKQTQIEKILTEEGRKNGSKGGKATLKKHGREHYIEAQKKSVEARKIKKLTFNKNEII